MKIILPRIAIISVVLVIIATVIFALVSYEYSNFTTRQILNLVDEQSRIEASTQSHFLAISLGNELESIANNLEIIRHSPALQNHEPRAIYFLDILQNTTSDISSNYGWLDKDGTLLWTSSKDQTHWGENFSYRDYFAKPKQTLMPYYSHSFQSLNNTLTLTISYPILNKQNNTFEGVMVAGIPVSKLGQFAKNQEITQYNSHLGMMDRDGVILYSADSEKYIGKSISGPEIQSLLPRDIKDQFNEFVKNSLNGQSGEVDFEYRGNSTTISYDPVKFSGFNFIVLYVSIPHTLTSATLDYVNQPRILSLSSIAIVGIIATIVILAILATNKRLHRLVESQTSDLKISNESLKEREKREKEFINIAAHELKTPIQSIILVLEDIEEDIKNGKRIELSQEYGEILLRNSKRLSILTNSLLKISKIENNSLTLKKEKVNLVEKINNVIKDVGKFIPPKQDLVINFTPDMENQIFVNADKNMLFEVLSNLILNAIKFTKQGVINVKLIIQDGSALVTIRDTGVGISPEIEPRIFDKFFSSDNGTGIGLFLSKNIIELHGGKLWFEKNNDGKGTTFLFTLPLFHPE